MLSEPKSWEYFLGEDLVKLGDWLIEVLGDNNLQWCHGIAHELLDKVEQTDPQPGEEYPAEEWLPTISSCWGLSEHVENYLTESETVSSAHEQPDWPTIYDYRDDGRQLI